MADTITTMVTTR